MLSSLLIVDHILRRSCNRRGTSAILWNKICEDWCALIKSNYTLRIPRPYTAQATKMHPYLPKKLPKNVLEDLISNINAILISYQTYRNIPIIYVHNILLLYLDRIKLLSINCFRQELLRVFKELLRVF